MERVTYRREECAIKLNQYLSSHVEGSELLHLYVGRIQDDKGEAALLNCLGEGLQ